MTPPDSRGPSRTARGDEPAEGDLNRRVAILGCRGIPARHGGFETFAESLGLYLTEQGWTVTVYCQIPGGGRTFEDEWCGIRRINLPIRSREALGTILFDIRSTWMAARREPLVLSLGYNTALLSLAYRLSGTSNLMNMDGLEWSRGKWTRLQRFWLWLNERLGSWLANHLIADHPEIREHLAKIVPEQKITMIPYTSERLPEADPAILERLGLASRRFALVVARPEVENSVLEIVEAFSARPREHRLVVVGGYDRDGKSYQRKVLDTASSDVLFPGAIYDHRALGSLRVACSLYIHGHTVGGTNPSLVEALGAGSPILAHDNPFNRWVAGSGAAYFASQDECATELDKLLDDEASLQRMRDHSLSRHEAAFTAEHVFPRYERLLERWSDVS